MVLPSLCGQRGCSRSFQNRKLASVRSRVPESNQLNARAYGRGPGLGRGLGVGVDLGSTVAVAVAGTRELPREFPLKSLTRRMAPGGVEPGHPSLDKTVKASKRHGLSKPGAVRTIKVAIGKTRRRRRPRTRRR
jgi:hypothetical protein